MCVPAPITIIKHLHCHPMFCFHVSLNEIFHTPCNLLNLYLPLLFLVFLHFEYKCRHNNFRTFSLITHLLPAVCNQLSCPLDKLDYGACGLCGWHLSRGAVSCGPAHVAGSAGISFLCAEPCPCIVLHCLSAPQWTVNFTM